jgi:hypothetical protein
MKRRPVTSFHLLASSVSTSLPPVNEISTNHQKLCFLSAWQSTAAYNSRLMKFSDDHAICIDTGASCCISNCKDDLIPFAPSSSTILKGISGGLSINGTGTLKWNILDDNGDEVALYIHNNLYIPDAPMCLLSPQHMAQQTPSNTDGFISKGSFGLLTFGGFHCTIYYNSSNNLPILATLHLQPLFHPLILPQLPFSALLIHPILQTSLQISKDYSIFTANSVIFT